MTQYIISYDLSVTASDNRNEDYQTLTDYLVTNGYCQEQKSVYIYSSDNNAEFIYNQLRSIISWHKEDKLLVSEFKRLNSKGITSECYMQVLKNEMETKTKKFKEYT